MRVSARRIGLLLIVPLTIAQFVRPEKRNPRLEGWMTIYSTESVPVRVQDIFERSCKDCHSNETQWPWYSHIAPLSWLIAHDVKKGRSRLNLSEWAAYSDKTRDEKLERICDQLRTGEMPDEGYTLIHQNARLTTGERNAVCSWTKSPRKSKEGGPIQRQ